MKQLLGCSNHFFPLVTSFLASSVLLASPSLAATFAASQGTLVLTDFSHHPLRSLTDANTDTVTVGKGGSVISQANASASLAKNPAIAFNSTSSEATGKNRNYSGFAESKATATGFFNIKENSWFSFNFAGNLNLETSVESPQHEKASAGGELFFALFDITKKQWLDYFQVTGNISTDNAQDFLDYQSINNITLNSQVTEIDQDFSHGEKSATANFNGSVERYFTNQTSVALISLNSNEVKVSAPEPSTIIALLFGCGVVSIVLKRSRQY